MKRIRVEKLLSNIEKSAIQLKEVAESMQAELMKKELKEK